MVFGEVVSQVEESGAPIQMKLALFDAVTHPEILHIESSGTPLFYAIGNQVMGSGVISANWSGCLGMAHFFKRHSHSTCSGSICENSS